MEQRVGLRENKRGDRYGFQTSDKRARFKNGVMEPLENLELNDGEGITLPIIRISETRKTQDAFRKSRGGWKDLIDCEKLKRDIHESRSIHI